MAVILCLSARPSGRGGRFDGGAIVAGNSTQRNGDAVPEIDHGQREGQVDNFFFAEMLPYFLERFVGYMGLRNVGDRFGPSERSAFAIGKERGFGPRIQGVKALLGFTFG